MGIFLEMPGKFLLRQTWEPCFMMKRKGAKKQRTWLCFLTKLALPHAVEFGPCETCRMLHWDQVAGRDRSSVWEPTRRWYWHKSIVACYVSREGKTRQSIAKNIRQARQNGSVDARQKVLAPGVIFVTFLVDVVTPFPDLVSVGLFLLPDHIPV